MSESTARGGETFAAYYAKYLIGRKGYQSEIVPELQPLAEICDYVLVLMDGPSFIAVAIIDREAHPEKVFSATVADVQHIAAECLRYGGQVGPTKMPVFIKIYEIGPDVIDPGSIARLTPYKREVKNAVVGAWLLDTKKNSAWTNMRFAGGLGVRRAEEKRLRSPRLDQSRLVARRLAIVATPHPPYFTFALIVLLVAIFAVEVAFSLDKTGDMLAPSLRTLQALGGLSHEAIFGQGQWWRIFTAPFLHADASHVGFNCLALFLIGRLLEPLIGWRWMAAIFAVSAVGGSLMSIAINPPNLIGVGASGGIVGLFAGALVAVYRIPPGRQQTRLVIQAVYGLVSTLLPFLNGVVAGGKVDYGAHFGGAIGGVAMSLALLSQWPGELARPKRPNFGATIALVFFVTAVGSIFPIERLYAEQTMLIPFWPSTTDQVMAMAPQLAQDYPHDPRARYANALVLFQKKDSAGAEVELRAGLAEKDILKDALMPEMEDHIRTMLAAILYDGGNKNEAHDVAGSACARETADFFGNLKTKQALCP